MIRINYRREHDRHQLTVGGHAGYAERGHDIVCAGVSAISFALLRYIQRCEVEADKISGEAGSLIIDCRGGERIACAFDMALCGWLQLAQNYPQCVEIHIAAEDG